jgi:hypothetical protein
MSVTPYGKDKLPDRLGEFFMRLSGVKFGKLNRSCFAGFESPDPAHWVENGYAVVQADVKECTNRKARRVFYEHSTHKTITTSLSG